MERYRNLSGNSGVTDYEIARDGIEVRFRGGDTYLYNYLKPGPAKVERMKALALEGRGLSTFISQHVGEDYAGKR